MTTQSTPPQPQPQAVRFAGDDANSAALEGLLVPFNGHIAGGKDSYGTRFTAETDYALDWARSGWPLLYQHGLDPETDITPVGRIDALEVRDAGVWMQAQLDQQSEYFGAIRDLVKAGKLYLSSGSVSHLVEIDARSGTVTRWPIVEGSLTPTPANLYATVKATALKSHCRSANIELAADVMAAIEQGAVSGDSGDGDGDGDGDESLRAVWSTKTQNDLPDSSFLYIEEGGTKDSEGKTKPRSKRHFPYKNAEGEVDLPHLKNALARIPQSSLPDDVKTRVLAKARRIAKKHGIDVSSSSGRAASMDGDSEADGGYEGSYEDLIDDLRDLLNPSGPFASGYTSIVATYPSYVIACTWRYDDGDSEQTYWKVAYSINADGEPALGQAVEVEQTYVPVAAERSAAAGPFTLDAQTLTQRAAAFAQRTQDLCERRQQEGRLLSQSNRTLLSGVRGQMTVARDALDALLLAQDHLAEQAARAANPDLVDADAAAWELLSLYAATLPQ